MGRNTGSYKGKARYANRRKVLIYISSVIIISFQIITAMGGGRQDWRLDVLQDGCKSAKEQHDVCQHLTGRCLGPHVSCEIFLLQEHGCVSARHVEHDNMWGGWAWKGCKLYTLLHLLFGKGKGRERGSIHGVSKTVHDIPIHAMGTEQQRGETGGQREVGEYTLGFASVTILQDPFFSRRSVI